MGLKRRIKKLEKSLDLEEKEPIIIYVLPWYAPPNMDTGNCVKNKEQIEDILATKPQIGVVYFDCPICSEECQYARTDERALNKLREWGMKL